LRSRLWMLGTIGATAPFVGLFGTVVGIMTAMGGFKADAEVKFSMVSGPISEALIVTAAGILVAVEAVILVNFFSQRAGRIATEMKLLTDEFLELLLEAPSDTQPTRARKPDPEPEPKKDTKSTDDKSDKAPAKGDGDGDREAA
jgi:biopolymer transport protein ExbB